MQWESTRSVISTGQPVAHDTEYKKWSGSMQTGLNFEEAARYQENQTPGNTSHVQRWSMPKLVRSMPFHPGGRRYCLRSLMMAVNHGTIIHTRPSPCKKLERLREESPAVFHCPLKALFNRTVRKRSSCHLRLITQTEPCTITVPRSGDKKKLLDLCGKNVQYFKTELMNARC